MNGSPSRPASTGLIAALAELLADRLPGLEADRAYALVVNAAGSRQAAGQLRDHLSGHAAVLTGPGSDVPPSLVRIAHLLVDEGFPGIVLPRCLDCAETPQRLPTLVDGGRVCTRCAARRARPVCSGCGKQAKLTSEQARSSGMCRACRTAAKPAESCTGCGRVLRIKKRLPDGSGRCQNCHQVVEACGSCGDVARVFARRPDGSGKCQRCYAPPTTLCARCGRERPVHANTDDGPVCHGCHRRPQRECGRCGQLAEWHARPRDGQPGFCHACYVPPTVACAICGNVRKAARSRRYGGAWACAGCRKRTEPCHLCGKNRPIIARWPIGNVCGGCYQHTRRFVAPCPACGFTHPLIGLNTEARRICGPCAGIAVDFSCAGCGVTGLTPIDRLCFSCLAERRVDELLSDSGGSIRPGLAPLAEALLGAGTREAVWQWLAPAKPTAALIASIAGTGEVLSHQMLDGLPQTPALHRLRAVLMHNGALDNRADHLERIAPWLEELLAERPSAHVHLVRSWTHWTLLRRARARLDRRPFTEGAAHAMRQAIRAALALLAWIDDTGTTLAHLTQADVDRWLTGERGRGAYEAKEFLRWAKGRRLTGDVAIPIRRSRTVLAPLPEEERWSALKGCLTDDGLPGDVRAAGSLLLLYGMTVSAITGLRREAVDNSGGACHLLIKGHRLRLAPAVGILICRRLHEIPAESAWLFPGAQPGRAITAAAMSRRLSEYGIPRRDQARAAALINLAAVLPPPVLADLLGLHVTTAQHWATHTQADWTAYLQARSVTQ